MPRLNKGDQAVVDEFGFEFSEPPERANTRRGKHFERWEKAKEVAQKYPGNSLKVLTFNQASSAYSTAKQINNNEHRQFENDPQVWVAVAGPDATEENEHQHAIWLTYNGQ